ncbi:MAG: exopolysaccharide biosynthesis protein [Bauldia sp.]
MPTPLPRRAIELYRPRAAPGSLEDLLDRLARAGSGSRVFVADVLAVVGERSFGPFIALAALMIASPLGVIPTLPTIIALMIGLVAAQLFVGMPRIWLPRFLLNRSIGRERLLSAVNKVRPLSQRVDRVFRRRLGFLTEGVFARVIAALCLMLVILIPPLELIPFAATIPALALAAFGLAIFLRDGLLALVAATLAGGSLALVMSVLF